MKWVDSYKKKFNVKVYKYLSNVAFKNDLTIGLSYYCNLYPDSSILITLSISYA